MWTYLVRRLVIMLVTLFGITVISFFIMWLAPGDPALAQLGGAGGQSSETRESYLLQKRDLHLDKPALINTRYFRDYTDTVRIAAYYRGRSLEQILKEVPNLAAADADRNANPEAAARLDFLRSLDIPEFNKRLADRRQWKVLAQSIDFCVMVYCEDTGVNGVPAAIAILQDASAPRAMKVGAVRCLSTMVPDAFHYTYSIRPTDEETAAVTGAWQLWWKRHEKDYPPPDAEARKYLDASLDRMVGSLEKNQEAASRKQMFAASEDVADNEDVRPFAVHYFAEKLFGDTPLEVKAAAAAALKQFVAQPLVMEIPEPVGATDRELAEAMANWLEYYRLHESEYEPGFAQRCWYVVADTQYAYLIARLVTFHFGRSALKTRDPVSELIWNAFAVSAPLMLASEMLIYGLAVPLGIFCGVTRGRWTDQTISLSLFLLNSIPGFIAAMLCLVFFCYGDYLKWFPMLGLHSDNAAEMTWWPYLADYLWHAVLPVICLSMFTLAAMAMYSRSAILDVISQDYIRTARAKGLAGRTVVLKHALRNALIPILTLFSSFLPAMLGGERADRGVVWNSGHGTPGFHFDSTKGLSNADGATLSGGHSYARKHPADRHSLCHGGSAYQL